MRPRCQIPAREVAALHDRLESRLERVGLSTRPEVAGKLIEVLEDHDTGVRDIARHLGTDAALTGRVLRLANSAHYAQRRAVTEVEHAAVLLGFDRLRRVATSFYVDRGDDLRADRLSRSVWVEGVFRGLFASELAARAFPGLARSAFVVGVMLDAGVPMMHRLLGDAYLDTVHDRADTPGDAYTREFERLPFTHVDLSCVLAKRWHLPNDLAKPIAWQHTRPLGRLNGDAVRVLHRLAFTVGHMPISPSPERDETPAVLSFKRELGVGREDVRHAFARAQEQYVRHMDEFAESAERLGSLESIHQAVHRSVSSEIDRTIESSLESEHGGDETMLNADDQSIRFTREDRLVVGYVLDDRGDPLACYRFFAHEETPATLCDAFQLDPSQDGVLDRLGAILQRFAA